MDTVIVKAKRAASTLWILLHAQVLAVVALSGIRVRGDKSANSLLTFSTILS